MIQKIAADCKPVSAREGKLVAEGQSEAQLISEEQGYRAYLLRCWREAGVAADGEAVWRFMLMDIDAHRAKKGFACLEDLTAHLRDELGMIR